LCGLQRSGDYSGGLFAGVAAASRSGLRIHETGAKSRANGGLL
jgi:hypothetical protein